MYLSHGRVRLVLLTIIIEGAEKTIIGMEIEVEEINPMYVISSVKVTVCYSDHRERSLC